MLHSVVGVVDVTVGMVVLVVVVVLVKVLAGPITVNDAELLVLSVSSEVSVDTSVRNMLKLELMPSPTLEETVTVACPPGMRLALQLRVPVIVQLVELITTSG